MKESKGINVTKRNIRQDFRKVYGYDVPLYSNIEHVNHKATQDMGCQADNRRGTLCTCRMSMMRRRQEGRYFNTIPKQIYAYHGIRSYTNIGVGNVKALQRRKVKKIYLPDTSDRGVGSSDLSTFVIRRPKVNNSSYYVSKRMSSKCVGGSAEPADEAVSRKLSPIVKCCCATTGSEMLPPSQEKNNNTGSNTEEKMIATTSTQVETGTSIVHIALDSIKGDETKDEHKGTPKDVTKVITKRSKLYMARKAREEEQFSSDSLVQHVHNLEHPSEDKPNLTSVDLMENKLEKEYREMFALKSKVNPSQEKTMQDRKSISLLRRRFEALRRGIKKDDSKKSNDASSSSPTSAASHKNVSIASDPPSLECRSFTKPSPIQPAPKYDRASFRQSVTGKKDSFQSTEDEETDCNDVSGLFKFWSKKFNLDEERNMTMKLSSDISKGQVNEEEISKIVVSEAKKKSEGKKFFFFKKRSKDKTKPEKPPYKDKKGVTTNRCEVKDGLMIKIGANTKAYNYTPTVPSKTEEILRKTWLKKFLNNTPESRDSVKVRWNNKTYTTSSSTVFELMENVYRQTGIVIRSKSDVSTTSKSNKSSGKRVNFVHQDIEAWMVPNTITDKPIVFPINSGPKDVDTESIEVRISDPKWALETAEAFPHKIELVLHAENIVQMNKDVSSDFLRIDIPRGFFSSDSANNEEPQSRCLSSDEEVYTIVEYETLKSNSDVRKKTNLDIGDRASNEIKVTVSVKDSKKNKSTVLEKVIKNPPTHRDVVTQGSDVFFPKRCDVIGVGIITQRDIREMKPILKLHDELSEDESEPVDFNPKKKCEFAESYLQDYYRHWMPLGIDHLSWCFSDCNVKCSEKNSLATVQQGDASKSCPNIYEEFRTPDMDSTSEVSSYSHHCTPYDDDLNNSIFFGKVKTDKKSQKGDEAPPPDGDKRVFPKDSLEVFKRRKIYASSNKSKWGSDFPNEGPYPIPSHENHDEPTNSNTSIIKKRPCCKPARGKCRRPSIPTKRVSLPDDVEAPERAIEGILTFKGAAGEKPEKTAVIQPEGCVIEIIEPRCKAECEKEKVPDCWKKKKDKKKDQANDCVCDPVWQMSDDKLHDSEISCASDSATPPQNRCGSAHLSPASSEYGERAICPRPKPKLKPCPPPPPTYSKNKSRPPSRRPPSPPSPRSPPTSKNKPRPSPCYPPSPPSPPRSPPHSKNKPRPLPCCAPPPHYPHPPRDNPKPQPAQQCTPSPPCPPSPPPRDDPKPRPKRQCPPPPPACGSTPVQISTPASECEGQISIRIIPIPILKPKPCPPPPPPSVKSKALASRCPPPPPGPPSAPSPLPPNDSTCARPCCYRPPKKIVPEPDVCPDETYPWPTNNQVSMPASPEYSKSDLDCRPQEEEEEEDENSPDNCNKNTLDTGVDAFSLHELSPCRPCPPRLCPPKPSPPKLCPTKPSPPKLCPTKPSPPKLCPTKPSPPKLCSTKPSPPKPSPPKSSPPELCPPKPSPPKAKPPKPSPPKDQFQCPPDPPSKCPYFSGPNQYVPPSCTPSPPPRLPRMTPHPVEELKFPANMPLPPSPRECCSQEPQRRPCRRMKSKIAGMFLKKYPSKKKTCVDDTNSEHLNIRVKACTPSTEEIRELKLRDEDGQTICERREYTQERTIHRPAVLGEMYNSSNVCQRLSTPSITRNAKVDKKESRLSEKSNMSIANLVEIQFRLKVTQGDKQTEISIGNDGDSEKEKITNTSKTCGSTVYVVNNHAESPDQDSLSNPKNDINIRIVIKNFKQKEKKITTCSEKCLTNHVIDDDYTRKISDKFQTVSTGYSKVWHCDTERNEETGNKALSIHRATSDFTGSEEKSKEQSKPGGELNNLTDKENVNFSSPIKVSSSTESVKKHEITLDEHPSIIEKNDNTKSDGDRTDDKDTSEDSKDTDQEASDQELSNRSNEANSSDVLKSSVKEDRKRKFKLLLERAGKMKNKDKEKVSEITSMLKDILTSESSREGVKATTNALVKDITYSGINPSFLRDTDSMNNYYKMSSMTSDSEHKDYARNNLSKEQSDSNDSIQEAKKKGCRGGCLCSVLAAKLNVPRQIGGCCCSGPGKVSIETNCDIRSDEDLFLLNYGTSSLVNKETQRSMILASKGNIANFSLHNSNSVIENNNISPQSDSVNDTESKSEKIPDEKVRKSKKKKSKIREEDKIIANMEPTKYKIETMFTQVTHNRERRIENKSIKVVTSADVLQSYETKKAVLEIYSKRTFTNGEEHLVAKLPKFVYERESEIRRYGEVTVDSLKQFCTGSVILSLER